MDFKVASLGASSGGGGDSFDPSASQTITGAWVFQSTLQRKTVASPALTDVMNSEIKLHGEGANGAYVIEGGNSTHLDVAVTSQFQEDVTCASSLIISPGHILQFGTDSYSVGVMANDDATAIVGGGPDSVLRFNVSVEISASSTFNGTANFLAGATRTTKATPADTDLMNKAMCDAAYAKLNISLTQAQYDGLATKDSRTIYVTTDTAKVFIGSVAVNP